MRLSRGVKEFIDVNFVSAPPVDRIVLQFAACHGPAKEWAVAGVIEAAWAPSQVDRTIVLPPSHS